MATNCVGFRAGNIERVQRDGRVRRAPLLRRFDALRKRFVQRQQEIGLPDFAASDRRLCGPDKALKGRARAHGSQATQPGDRVRRLVRGNAGRLVAHEVSRLRRRVSI